jgi:hypothetical protein
MEEKNGEEDYVLIDSENLDEEFVKAVGRLTLNFANLEFMFTMFAGMQMGIGQPFNELILAEMSFKQLLNVSAGIYKVVESSPKEQNKFNKILKEAFILEQQRNTITHSFYGHNNKTKIIVRHKNTTKAKQGFKKHTENINAESVNKIATKMLETSRELGVLIYEISGALQTENDKP